jgi:hypothetical protein
MSDNGRFEQLRELARRTNPFTPIELRIQEMLAARNPDATEAGEST